LHLEKEKRKRDVWEIDTPSKSTFYRSFYREKSGTHPDRSYSLFFSLVLITYVQIHPYLVFLFL
jgi:hypothetical protein